MRQIPIHDSLLRPQLLAGGERELVIINATLSAALIFGVGGLIGIITGVIVWGVGQFALVQLAAKDDNFREVFARQIHQQKVYPASATPDAQFAYGRKPTVK
jgi:type IV secretion system protein VirB3